MVPRVASLLLSLILIAGCSPSKSDYDETDAAMNPPTIDAPAQPMADSGFAGCAEHILRVRCEALGWRQPKSSRLASSSDFPWRAVSQSEAPSPS